METGNTLLELATDAYSLYITGDSEEKIKILNNLCSNFLLKDGKVSYEYKKPFNILAEGLNRQIKRGGRGSNPRPPA